MNAPVLEPVDASSPAFIVATAIFVVTYIGVMSEHANRAVVALLGAGVMVIVGIINQQQAIAGIDFNTIALLTGTMIIVSITKDSGVFQYVAIRSAQLVGASPAGMLALLSIVTAIVSAVLNNVTTVLLIAPVAIALCRELKLTPFPFLFTIVLASNIGGAATLIGDPPNILIGSAAGLTFDAFLVNLGPVVALIMAAQLIVNHLIWGARMRAAPEDRKRVAEKDAKAEITDWRRLWHSLFVNFVVIAAFVFSDFLGLQVGTIAMTGGAALIFLDNLSRNHKEHHEHVTNAFNQIEWITLFFFIGLFIIVTGVERAGLIAYLGHQLVAWTGGDFTKTGIAVLWGSAILSSILDNIPFVATMIPLIKSLAPAFGGEAKLVPLWWSLALGACLGGNGTLVGAAANLTVAGIAERSGVAFGFVKFTAYAFVMMLVSIAVCQVYLMLRYF